MPGFRTTGVRTADRAQKTLIYFALGAALMCAPGAVRSQEHPVTWKLSPPAQLRGGLVAKLDATIEDGWHLYSMTQPAGGPVPTSIAVVGNGFALSGKPRAPEPDHIPDRNFNIISEVYSDSVHFTLPLSRAAARHDSLRIAVRYQACTNRVCMPPRTDTLVVSGVSRSH
jgi:thiol:disulfide interchange protein DsbD